jgi:hypothetical protein
MMSFIGAMSLLSSLPRVVPPSIVRPAPLGIHRLSLHTCLFADAAAVMSA